MWHRFFLTELWLLKDGCEPTTTAYPLRAAKTEQ